MNVKKLDTENLVMEDKYGFGREIWDVETFDGEMHNIFLPTDISTDSINERLFNLLLISTIGGVLISPKTIKKMSLHVPQQTSDIAQKDFNNI